MLQRLQSWPPDYTAHYAWRTQTLAKMRASPRFMASMLEYYRTRPVEFIEHWCDTFDPRNAGTDRPVKMPFILFQRQREFVEFLKACLDAEANGLVEKSRDMGATWLCVAFSVWLFLFVPGANVGWGSRHAIQVDRLGDMNSIFEKIRQLLMSLRHFWPVGFDHDCMNYMKIHAPNGNSITGECGDNIGRGGRAYIIFKDEAAHYEHPEAIEAALSDTTRVQIDISSVNGLGNVFHRKRESGIEWSADKSPVKGRVNVFVMDWSDHPTKTKSWYDEREQSAIDAGLLHVFRQEVDRNYAASVEGVVIPAAWVKSAIDAHLVIGGMEDGQVVSGLDVADSGGDRNALATRRGVLLDRLDEWGERDTGVTARRAIAGLEGRNNVSVQYDSIGVGSGVKAETNRLRDDGLLPKGVEFVSWDAGSGVQEPDEHVEPGDAETPLNKDFYSGLKAQAWWNLRRRFEKTHRAVTEGIWFNPDELISIDSNIPLLRSLQKELSQPTASMGTRMRLVIDKTPKGSKSPNLADAVVMAFFPVKQESTYDTSLSWVGDLSSLPKQMDERGRFAQDAWSRGMVP